MEELWGLSKEQIIENIGEPHRENFDENHNIEELTYFYPPEKDFQPEKEVTYGFVQNRLSIISTGYDFKENLFRQYEHYHDSLVDKWKENIDQEPSTPTFEDENGNKVTMWSKENTEVILFFSNDPSEPKLVVVQKFNPVK